MFIGSTVRGCHFWGAGWRAISPLVKRAAVWFGAGAVDEHGRSMTEMVRVGQVSSDKQENMSFPECHALPGYETKRVAI
ncbi:hypothetical protein PX554_15330 [Sphingomonas sp. H39-1-10]|uniref:hypothetical protein n=1 Tax=Sphingomonas pollutisoli TaxID=3030829 RepID=UPI0023B94A02|nr:hypothetical protein [Sphingomonas pollutisoli]MDF0489508.1 hypothetical protein [Sphingomonas pollutisoli]